ncbi:hypothetical protein AR158_c524L [Paramecium bursaria Chlorella virus AR158]|uniref:hypothetical protein n=1 Tax=Paramecium bursaria Chlorella virus AR158 TaxID=380598 RepID=UPI00015AA73A|nr:hypothetical protein AR158_c524L [Paramecium bursaria Chlorella virus AR158]ABU44069.1 hypothetical protein AR158_c524L [Paramecium bursaria Chlorella virus AR158]
MIVVYFLSSYQVVKVNYFFLLFFFALFLLFFTFFFTFLFLLFDSLLLLLLLVLLFQFPLFQFELFQFPQLFHALSSLFQFQFELFQLSFELFDVLLFTRVFTCFDPPIPIVVLYNTHIKFLYSKTHRSAFLWFVYLDMISYHRV